MVQQPPRSTRSDTRFPYPTLFRSTEAAENTHEIFDRRLRRMRRDRAARNFAAHDFLYRYVADELFDRLGDVTRQFTRALLIGCPDEYMRDGLAGKGTKVVRSAERAVGIECVRTCRYRWSPYH